MVDCKYNEDNKYYCIHFRNKIDVSELINISNKCSELSSVKDMKLIADFRKSKIDISEYEIELFQERILHYNSELKIRAAIIQEDPILTAYTMLFIDKLKQPKIDIKLFSTREAAENWLLTFD